MSAHKPDSLAIVDMAGEGFVTNFTDADLKYIALLRRARSRPSWHYRRAGNGGPKTQSFNARSSYERPEGSSTARGQRSHSRSYRRKNMSKIGNHLMKLQESDDYKFGWESASRGEPSPPPLKAKEISDRMIDRRMKQQLGWRHYHEQEQQP